MLKHPSIPQRALDWSVFYLLGVKVSQPHFQISLKVFGFLEHKHDLLSLCGL